MADAPTVDQTTDIDLAFDLAFDAAAVGEPQTPEPQAQTPEPQAQIPEPQAQTPEPQAQTPEPQAQTPEPQAQTPEPQAQTPEPQAQTPEPQAQTPEPPAEYKPTDEEVQQLETLRTEYPEVASALTVYEKVMVSKFEKVLAEQLAQVHAQYAPVVATTQRIAQNEHEATILKSHADAFSIVNDVSAWVNTQPSIIRASYAAVLKNGTAAEVVQLLDLYKQAVKPPAPAPPEPPKIDKEKERKLQALEGVRSRNTSERAAIDPDDFEGAFEKFAAKA